MALEKPPRVSARCSTFATATISSLPSSLAGVDASGRAVGEVPEIGAAAIRRSIANHEALASWWQHYNLPVANNFRTLRQVALGQQAKREEGRYGGLHACPPQGSSSINTHGQVVVQQHARLAIGQRARDGPSIDQGNA
eukprot:scaffold30346_cov30-Tisochrysis_lutea.AAC.1